ncbi:MAG: hypothetical protein LBG43_00405 [Treponema sp.]|nr:hypothetical protein [Treponema sp.]
MLKLAGEADDASETRKRIGCSPGRFYEIRRNLHEFGAEGLLDKDGGEKAPHFNRLSEADEKIILDCRLEFPTQGGLRARRRLEARGGGAIHSPDAKERFALTGNHAASPEKFDPEFRGRHDKSDVAGELAGHARKRP